MLEKWERETMLILAKMLYCLWHLLNVRLPMMAQGRPLPNTFLWVKWKSALQRPLCWRRILRCLKKRTKNKQTSKKKATDTVRNSSEKYPVHSRVTHIFSQPEWWSNWRIHFDTTAQNSKLCIPFEIVRPLRLRKDDMHSKAICASD